jgi:hypothetical protein
MRVIENASRLIFSFTDYVLPLSLFACLLGGGMQEELYRYLLFQ